MITPKFSENPGQSAIFRRGPILNSNRDLKMSYFLHHFTPPHDDPILPEIWSILIRNYLPKGVNFGYKWIARHFPKILVKSRAT